jgi:hypothetical protein
MHQLHAACSSTYVEFGVVTGDLVSEAKQLLNSDSELQCATASEPDRRRKGKNIATAGSPMRGRARAIQAARTRQSWKLF